MGVPGSTSQYDIYEVYVSHVLLAAFSNRHDAIGLAQDVIADLATRGVSSSIQMLDDVRDVPLSASDLVVSLGGDGTFLRAARLAHSAGARVLGVELGRLGFLLNVPPGLIAQEVEIELNRSTVEERLALEVSISREPRNEFALNEVVVERLRNGQMVRVQTFVGSEEYLTYSADGVLVSTPTGSTGYNFSAGGPVVDNTLPVMILTPIAPHFTIDRSIVLGDDAEIMIKALDKPACVLADGQEIGTINPGEFVTVRKSAAPVRVVASRSFDLVHRLRKGLREGHA
jgi:NAD+ kinase